MCQLYKNIIFTIKQEKERLKVIINNEINQVPQESKLMREDKKKIITCNNTSLFNQLEDSVLFRVKVLNKIN